MCDTEVARVDGSIVVVDVLHSTCRYTEMQPCFKACCSLALRRALPLQQFQKCPAQRSRSNQQQQSHTVCA